MHAPRLINEQITIHSKAATAAAAVPRQQGVCVCLQGRFLKSPSFREKHPGDVLLLGFASNCSESEVRNGSTVNY